MLGLLMGHFFCLLLTGGLVLVAAGLGRLTLSRIGAPCVSFAEGFLFSLGLGFGVLGYAVFVLCCLGLLSPGPLSVVLGAAALLGVWGWWKGGLLPGGLPAAPKNLTVWDRVALGLLAVFVLLALLLVLTPAIGKDALIYHLAVPKHFLKQHGFFFIEGNIFAHYPLSQEMLYGLALFLHGEVLAKAVHAAMALALLAGMWLLARNHLEGIVFTPVSLLIFFTVPSVFGNAHVAYNDLAVSLYVFLALYAFIGWTKTEKGAWLVVCGIFVGLAMSTKYTALFLPFLGFLGICWGARRQGATWKHAVISLAAFVIPAGIVGSPFYLKNWLMTGNPFYPFLWGIFGGKGLDGEQAQLYDLFVQHLGMGRGLLDYLLLPWNVSVQAEMSSPRFDGVIGPVFLLALPFALGIRRPATPIKILLVFSGLSFLFWASTAQQIRYLIPILPPLALVISYLLTWYRERKIVFGLLTVLVVGSVGFNGFLVFREFRKINPVGVILGREDRDAFLQRTIPSFEMYQAANEIVPQDGKVLLVYMKNLGYLCERPYYSDSMFEAHTLKKILSQAAIGEDVALALKAKGFTHLMFDAGYVAGEMSPLSSEQKALFSEFLEDHGQLLKVGQGRYYLYGISEHTIRAGS